MSTRASPSPQRQNALGHISVLYASVLLRAAEAEGANTEQLTSTFGLSADTLSSPAARISIPRYMRLGHAAIAQTGNRALGLRMGALTRPVDTGIAGERYFEALNGIQEGDLIITGPFSEVRNLTDGDDIRIASGNESSEAGERSGGFQLRFGG